ncbi:MAG: 4Fe-4S binding protein, partial [Firmicutes bacterium]|nr:4Fe-4S binding protein [Bacillota bacterium]
PRIGRNCRNCGICATVCPAGAIRAGRRRAVIDEGKCIRCYCCDEMCPHGAVALVRGVFGRF